MGWGLRGRMGGGNSRGGGGGWRGRGEKSERRKREKERPQGDIAGEGEKEPEWWREGGVMSKSGVSKRGDRSAKKAGRGEAGVRKGGGETDP